MGSQAIQSKLWGQRPGDWASVQEQTGLAGYTFALDAVGPTPGTRLLDVGCGTGYFSQLASSQGAQVTGLDATPAFVAAARERVPTATFVVGEMEELPFPDGAFDLVCGFNSFQYAANVKNALLEAKRVLADAGQLVAMIWGNKEECEAATYLKAVGGLLPPPPPGAPGPFALSENSLLENILQEIGLKIELTADVPAEWNYPDVETALRGLVSAGPVARAVEHVGFEQAYATIASAVRPYVQPNGRVVYHNKYRIVVAKKVD